MPINGVQTAVFGVEDLELCDKFFTDFGLKIASKSDTAITYSLPEGSYVDVNGNTVGPVVTMERQTGLVLLNAPKN